MISIKRSYIHKMFTSLSGVICFFLFAVQLNCQYIAPVDPSADVKDPVSIVARAVSSSSLFGTEHLPVYKEDVRVIPYQAFLYPKFYTPEQSLVISNRILPSLRGPPAADLHLVG